MAVDRKMQVHRTTTYMLELDEVEAIRVRTAIAAVLLHCAAAENRPSYTELVNKGHIDALVALRTEFDTAGL